MIFDAWRIRLRALVSPRVMEEELDEELRYHLDAEIARNIAAGMTPNDARLAARRAFGNSTQLKEEVRDGWGRRWLEHLGQDTRYAWRAFRRAPVFSFTVIGTIALALGLNTTAFTVFEAYALRPAAVRDPGSLVQLTWSDRSGAGHAFSWRDYQTMRTDRDVLAELFAYRLAFMRIDSTPSFGQLVTGNYFTMLGVGSSLGRTLIPSDASAPHTGAVVVLSHAAWKSRFGGDSSILGQSIRLRGHPFQVVGVAQPGFTGLGDIPLDFWVPLTMNDVLFDGDSLFGGRDIERLTLVGRLRSGVTVGAGEGWLLAWIRAHRPDTRAREVPANARLLTRATAIRLSPGVALFFAPIATAFGLVLLIACANVANMMLARGMARQRELGVRLSLGAGRRRLVAQLLTEAALLAVPATLLGFLIARFTIDSGLRLMYRTLSAELAPYIRVVPLTFDGRIFLFTLGASAASVLLFGLAPALQATRTNIVQATRGEFGVDVQPSRLRNGLVIGQVTVCVLLLVCAGVLLAGIADLQHPDAGLTTQNVLRLDLQDPTGTRTRILDALHARPDVRLIAAAGEAPFGGRFPSVTISSTDRRVTSTYYNFVTGSYFDLLGMRVLRGRSFTADEERAGAPVAIVSEATARALWPGREAIGERVRLMLDSSASTQRRFATRNGALIVGIVPNVALGTIIDPLESAVVYYPTNVNNPGTLLLAGVAGPSDIVLRRLDKALAQLAPEAVVDIHTLDAFRLGSLYPFRAAYWVSAALGLIALLLTLTGVYGVLSYVVAQRRKELGIRVALGATSTGLAGLVLAQSLRLCTIGLALGTALALLVARVFAANLLKVDTFQPSAFVGAAAIVVISCLAAAYVPSRRAGQADPMDALREA
jgi:predicted permease